jgi:hypothetical protein
MAINAMTMAIACLWSVLPESEFTACRGKEYRNFFAFVERDCVAMAEYFNRWHLLAAWHVCSLS